MIQKLLKDGERIDGRNLKEYRNISIRFPKNLDKINIGGSCLVSFGDTSVLAKITCSVVKPKSTHPSRGLIKLNMDTSWLKNNSNKLRRSTEETLKLEPKIKDVLRDSIDMDSLCICAGEKVFCVNIDVKAQTDDGNLLDVIVLATTIALTTFKRPDVSIGEAGEFVVHEDMLHKEPVALKLRKLPIFVTLGVDVESNLIILDLDKAEEETLDSRLVICMTPTGEMPFMFPLGAHCWLYKALLDRCIELVMKKVVALQCLVSQAVEAVRSTDETLVINSHSFLPTHPIFVDNAAIEVEEPKQVHDAPETIDDDMEMESDEGEVAEVDDWARIDSLMTHTQQM